MTKIDQRFVVGCDFGASSKAGLQAKKTVLIEAERLSKGLYQCHEFGRNARLLRHQQLPEKRSAGSWQNQRLGWTIADLADSLAADQSIAVAAFDFPFSIPVELLDSVEFAAAVGQKTFQTRANWAAFLRKELTLRFDSTKASAALTCLSKVTAWKQQAFWQKRQTDHLAKAQPPLKHLYQSVFNMTVLGTLLLADLESTGMAIVLTERQLAAKKRRCVEAYPALVAKRIGIVGSYKQQPAQCIQKAIAWLALRGITLQLPDNLKTACQNYQTAENDYDAADAFLCLVTSICVQEDLAEILIGTAKTSTQLEEGGIVVPLDLPQPQQIPHRKTKSP